MEEIALLECREYRYDLLKKVIDEQFELLGFQKIVKQGCSVVIKPNLVMKTSPETASVTHPLVTAAVGCWCRERGADVIIAESPGGPYTPVLLKSIYHTTGYQQMAEEYNLTLNTDCSYSEVEAPGGVRSKLFHVINPIVQADVVVNIAKLKTHCMTMMSGAVKNMFGSVPGLMKPELHCRFPEKPDFCEMLVDLCELLAPQINVLDGVVAMEGNGPTGGRPRPIGAIVSGANPFAVDVAGARLMAMSPGSVQILQSARKRGLCPQNLEEIQVLGDDLERFVVEDFLQPESKTSNFINRLPGFLRPMAAKIATPLPKIREKDCIGCGKCAESCPQHTISVENRLAKIHYQDCIRCYCCHEMCPERAIDIKRFSLFKL